MPDTTELDYIRTLLGLIHTAATVKHVEEHGNTNIDQIVDASYQRILIYLPELISNDGLFRVSRYQVKISESSQANMIIALNNILIGIDKFNRRQTIDGWTYASYPTMCHIRLVNSNKAYLNFSTRRWYMDIWIDVEWSTS